METLFIQVSDHIFFQLFEDGTAVVETVDGEQVDLDRSAAEIFAKALALLQATDPDIFPNGAE